MSLLNLRGIIIFRKSQLCIHLRMSFQVMILGSYSLVIASCWRREGDASVFNVVHDEGQPLTLSIMVSVKLNGNCREY